MRSKQHHSSTPVYSQLTPDDLMDRTKEIEEQKLEKQAARRRRAAEKAAAKKRQRLERMIAPILLLLTILVGILVQLLYR